MWLHHVVWVAQVSVKTLTFPIRCQKRLSARGSSRDFNVPLDRRPSIDQPEHRIGHVLFNYCRPCNYCLRSCFGKYQTWLLNALAFNKKLTNNHRSYRKNRFTSKCSVQNYKESGNLQTICFDRLTTLLLWYNALFSDLS